MRVCLLTLRVGARVSPPAAVATRTRAPRRLHGVRVRLVGNVEHVCERALLVTGSVRPRDLHTDT